MTDLDLARQTTAAEDDTDDDCSPRVILISFLAVAVWLGAIALAVLL